MGVKSIEYYRNCPVGRYHNFKVDETNDRAQVETCRFCSVRKVYKFKTNGQLVDNEAYFKDHIRFFAQPSQEVYYDINPDAAANMLLEQKKQEKSVIFQNEMGARFKHAIKKALE